MQVKGIEPKLPEGRGLQSLHDPYVTIPTMLSLGIIPASAEHKDRNIPERESGARCGNRTRLTCLEGSSITRTFYPAMEPTRGNLCIETLCDYETYNPFQPSDLINPVGIQVKITPELLKSNPATVSIGGVVWFLRWTPETWKPVLDRTVFVVACRSHDDTRSANGEPEGIHNCLLRSIHALHSTPII